jgi:anti-sigma regulatory factor (Ser/Thr protein kinase)
MLRHSSEGPFTSSGFPDFGYVRKVEHGVVTGARGQIDDHAAADFRHEALLYAGTDGFLEGTVPFIQEGIAAGEPCLVVVGDEKIELLQGELGRDAEHVKFADMGAVGSNPAWIIQAWRDFVAERSNPGAAVRGIGEPINSDRPRPELVECQRHESLLNLAFAKTRAFWLVCPYDTEALDQAVIDEALRSHPVLATSAGRADSTFYRGLEASGAPFTLPLPEPVEPPRELYFEAASLAALRQYVALRAADARLDAACTEDLLLAVNEVATNSLRHGAGWGYLRVWEEPEALICEVRDEGVFDEPLAGRLRPVPTQIGGYGLWLANQVCDLVQVRSLPKGSVVRLHMRRT